MATMSAAAATSTLTPPSSSHGNGYSWDLSANGRTEDPIEGKKAIANHDFENGIAKPAHLPSKRNSSLFTSESYVEASPKKSSLGDPYATMKSSGLLSPSHGVDSTRPASIKESNSPADSLLDLYGSGKKGPPNDPAKKTMADPFNGDYEDDHSKWIHRDKLARIESEELQAAGIILPKPRARSKPRRDMGLDKVNGHRKAEGAVPGAGAAPGETRSRKNSAAISEPQTPDVTVPAWDLRLPEEIAEDPGNYFVPTIGGKGVSRIPVAKLSPVPIPVEHMERDTRMPRKRDDSPGAEETITYPKTRSRSRSGSMKALDSGAATSAAPVLPAKRSGTDISPKRTTGAGSRKSTGPAKSNSTAGSKGRGASKDSTGSGGGQQRPPTRSGERELSPSAMSKQPEGDPPWMVSAYKPDPRLPPDQQLLPTVAKRLQQEKWEREGKFGNIYDKEFRPLTDEGFLKPPEQGEKSNGGEGEGEGGGGGEKQDEWPLKPEAKGAVSEQGRKGSYSTIPKIQDKPNVSPLPSPRGAVQQQVQITSAGRPPAGAEEDETTKGCGCCVIM